MTTEADEFPFDFDEFGCESFCFCFEEINSPFAVHVYEFALKRGKVEEAFA